MRGKLYSGRSAPWIVDALRDAGPVHTFMSGIATCDVTLDAL